MHSFGCHSYKRHNEPEVSTLEVAHGPVAIEKFIVRAGEGGDGRGEAVCAVCVCVCVCTKSPSHNSLHSNGPGVVCNGCPVLQLLCVLVALLLDGLHHLAVPLAFCSPLLNHIAHTSAVHCFDDMPH